MPKTQRGAAVHDRGDLLMKIYYCTECEEEFTEEELEAAIYSHHCFIACIGGYDLLIDGKVPVL